VEEFTLRKALQPRLEKKKLVPFEKGEGIVYDRVKRKVFSNTPNPGIEKHLNSVPQCEKGGMGKFHSLKGSWEETGSFPVQPEGGHSYGNRRKKKKD